MHQPDRRSTLNNSRPTAGGNRLHQQQERQSLAATSAPGSTQQVRQIPLRQSAPVWLRSLLTAQKAAMILFASVFGLCSIVYGYTMHTQTTWRTQQDQLRRWQNQERQQGVMNEKLKQELAKKAESKDSGLVAPTPQMSVFVRGAAPRPPKPLPQTIQAPKSTPLKIPSGY